MNDVTGMQKGKRHGTSLLGVERNKDNVSVTFKTSKCHQEVLHAAACPQSF